MPKYRVLAKTYINDKIHEENEIIEYNNEYGTAGSSLELIKDDSQDDVAEPVVKQKATVKAKRSSDAD